MHCILTALHYSIYCVDEAPTTEVRFLKTPLSDATANIFGSIFNSNETKWKNILWTGALRASLHTK